MSPHFTLEELTHSETATRKGIDNTPPPDVLDALKKTAMGMEVVRNLLGVPILITSGYRCLELNRAIGSKDNSHHVKGYAVDFIAPKYGTPEAIVKRLEKSALPFDQCIQEGKWVHISFAPSMRRQVLTAHFANGKATYTQGIV